MSGASEGPAIPERLHAIPRHFDVPEDVRELARFLVHRAGYRDSSRDELATGIAIMCADAIMADRLARPVDTGREKALEEAAKVAETAFTPESVRKTAKGVPYSTGQAAIYAGARIAGRIRALANPENGRG